MDGSTWSGDGLDRLRELAGVQRDDPARDQRLRARPPVALARGHRLDLRRPGLPAVPALAARGSRSPTRPTTRPARPGRRTSSSRSTTSAGSRRGWAWAWSSRSLRSSWPARRRPRPLRSSNRADDGPRTRGDAVRRPGRGRRGRPADRVDDAGRHDAARRAARRATRLGAAGRRDRRGRDRPRPRLAGRRRGARPAFPGPATDRGRPARRGDRIRPARPCRGRGAALGGVDHRCAGDAERAGRRAAADDA